MCPICLTSQTPRLWTFSVWLPSFFPENLLNANTQCPDPHAPWLPQSHSCPPPKPIHTHVFNTPIGTHCLPESDRCHLWSSTDGVRPETTQGLQLPQRLRWPHPRKWTHFIIHFTLQSLIWMHVLPQPPRRELCQIQKWAKEITQLKDLWTTQQPGRKMGKDYELQEKEIQMDLHLVKKCSTALIKEMQIEMNWDTNFHLSDWQRSKSLITHCAGEDVSFIKGVNCYNLLERILATSTNTTDVYVLLPAIPLLRIHPADILLHMQNGMYMRILTAVWSVMTEDWKQPQKPLSRECFNKLWLIRKMECYADVNKNNEGILYVMIWDNLPCILLGKTIKHTTVCQ